MGGPAPKADFSTSFGAGCDIKSVMPKRRVETLGKTVSGICIAVMVILVLSLIFMVAQKGLATFLSDGVSPLAFLTGTRWSPSSVDETTGLPYLGSLPMIVGSFSVSLLAVLIALP
ncbi:MAG: hypothetical protein KHY83_11805, partial [Coriobacteriia bacterium]|nr:hypothetical protein [Coriobacteriia bacterium]